VKLLEYDLQGVLNRESRRFGVEFALNDDRLDAVWS
jgi:hypothetical protein